jgi:hypothetical protein
MSKKNLTDYYPVYKELEGTPAMLNAEELIDQAEKCGLNTFQIAILLVKNAFEGHVFLTFQIRPDQLFSEGTILLKAKPELLLLNFYENFAQYKPGLMQSELYLTSRRDDFAEISFEKLTQHILVNQIIRFPVAIFCSFDIKTLKGLPVLNQKTMEQRFALILLCERYLGEFTLAEQTNQKYFDKFFDLGQQLRLKEEVLSHYQKKFLLAPFVSSDHDLDDLMYQKLIEEKLNTSSQYMENLRRINHENTESSPVQQQIKEKIKLLYRAVSKNCMELHTSTDDEKNFFELNEIFQEANTIYNEPVGLFHEYMLNYMRLLLLLGKLLVFRKSADFEIARGFQLNGKEILLSKDDLKLLEANLDEQLINYRLRNFTDYKLKFVVDDELTEIHSHFLNQQIEYIDNQILQIQSDIKEILKIKSQKHQS